jgi:hypothetical protein
MSLTCRTAKLEKPLATETITEKTQVSTYAVVRAPPRGDALRYAAATGSPPDRLSIQVAKATGTLLLLSCNG